MINARNSTLAGTGILLRQLRAAGAALTEVERVLEARPDLKVAFEEFIAAGGTTSGELVAWLHQAAIKPKVVWTNPTPPNCEAPRQKQA